MLNLITQCCLSSHNHSCFANLIRRLVGERVSFVLHFGNGDSTDGVSRVSRIEHHSEHWNLVRDPHRSFGQQATKYEMDEVELTNAECRSVGVSVSFLQHSAHRVRHTRVWLLATLSSLWVSSSSILASLQ